MACSQCGRLRREDRDEPFAMSAEYECECEEPTCSAPGCDQPATEEIYEQRVCRKHLTLWSA